MVITLIFALVLAIIAVIFALQNPTLIAANFFGYEVESSLALFVLIGLGVGLLIGVLVMTPGRIKSSFANSRHRKKIGELESSHEEHKVKAVAVEKKEPSAPIPPPDETPKSTS